MSAICLGLLGFIGGQSAYPIKVYVNKRHKVGIAGKGYDLYAMADGQKYSWGLVSTIQTAKQAFVSVLTSGFCELPSHTVDTMLIRERVYIDASGVVIRRERI